MVGIAPLIKAAENGYSDVCINLIKKGANVNAKYWISFWSPLHGAVSEGHEEVVKALIAGLTVGKSIEASKNKLDTLLLCFNRISKDMPFFNKDIRLYIVSFCEEVSPYLLYLAIRGSALPKVLMDIVKTERNEKRKSLKPLMDEARKSAKSDKIRRLLHL